MQQNYIPLVQYGEKVITGQLPKQEKEEIRRRREQQDNIDESDPISLKSYLDTILPPREVVEVLKKKEKRSDSNKGSKKSLDEDEDVLQVYLQFVSCNPATNKDVIKLYNLMEAQMKARNARETGICSVREQIVAECLDELIRQITINCLQRGDLLNSIKEQINEVILNYQKLYESAMACQMRKVLIEEKKKKKLTDKSDRLTQEIEDLKRLINDKEQEIDDKARDFAEKEKIAKQDHEDMVKSIKLDMKSKQDKLTEILTTPKQLITQKK